MRNQIKECYRKLGHQRVTFSGEGQTRNKLAVPKETARKCPRLKLVTGWREAKKKSPRRIWTTSWCCIHTTSVAKKTSSREFNFKWSQTGNVPRWLSQVNIILLHTSSPEELGSNPCWRPLRHAINYRTHSDFRKVKIQGEMCASAITEMQWLFS